MRNSDWSSDVCSSDLRVLAADQQLLLLADDLEEFDQAAGRLVALLEVGGAGLVGGGFLPAGVSKKAAFGDLLAAQHGSGRGIARRSEERRVGKESVSTCRSRWSQ